MFEQQFSRYACDGDTITCRVPLGKHSTGLRLEARLYRDDDTTPPDERQCGYWPSLDPENAGYIGPKSKATLAKHRAKAQAVLDAWRNDEWWYVGVAVRAYFDDLPLTGEYDFAVWGTECNYPDYHWKGKPRGWYPNHHLQELANECALECAPAAIRALTVLVEAGQEALDND